MLQKQIQVYNIKNLGYIKDYKAKLYLKIHLYIDETIFKTLGRNVWPLHVPLVF